MHLISTKDLDKQFIDDLMVNTDKVTYHGCLEGCSMATLFFEPSTRTRLSFEQAISKDGGKFSSICSPGETSSISKGEDLQDMIQTLNSLAFDFVVIRHPEKNFGLSNINDILNTGAKIINAGDGDNEHPSQALLDFYTIYRHFGKSKKLNIALCGDILYSRTIRSLLPLLDLYGHDVYLFPYKGLESGDLREIDEKQFMEILPKIDVLYMTRSQLERHENKINNNFIVNNKIMSLMKSYSIVMHPLPRNNEISKEVDNDKRCIYFRQVYNGLILRVALLRLLA